jgi:hypothetical protein
VDERERRHRGQASRAPRRRHDGNGVAGARRSSRPAAQRGRDRAPDGNDPPGVQRVADELVDRGLAEYRPNRAHWRAKLLAYTEAGHWAIRQIALVQRPWADRIGGQIGAAELSETLTTIRRLLSALDADEATRGRSSTRARPEQREREPRGDDDHAMR